VDSDIKSILDVGAHQGMFTKEMQHYFPYAHYHMIEANEHCESYLKQVDFAKYTICLLSNEEKPMTYFVNKNDLTSTGNSYYKELTEHFTQQSCIKVVKQATTLDKLFTKESFDFIKIDTQGSELDILKGGQQLVRKTKYILLECSVEQYNEGSPLINEVVSYVESIGFKLLTEVYQHIQQGRLFQKDLLFKNNNYSD
jgi:FkbM family methyltransferase